MLHLSCTTTGVLLLINVSGVVNVTVIIVGMIKHANIDFMILSDYNNMDIYSAKYLPG